MFYTHTQRHAYTRICAWVYNSSIHSVHQGDQLTVDVTQRAHQSPGRLVDEDVRSERSPSRTADRSGSEQRGVPCVGACSPPGTASLSTERGRLASCPSSPSLVSSSLFADKTVRADGVTHRSVHSDTTYACVHTYRIYIRRAGSRAAVCGIHPS